MVSIAIFRLFTHRYTVSAVHFVGGVSSWPQYSNQVSVVLTFGGHMHSPTDSPPRTISCICRSWIVSPGFSCKDAGMTVKTKKKVTSPVILNQSTWPSESNWCLQIVITYIFGSIYNNVKNIYLVKIPGNVPLIISTYYPIVIFPLLCRQMAKSE